MTVTPELIFEIDSWTIACSSGPIHKITDITRPSCCISDSVFAFMNPKYACFKYASCCSAEGADEAAVARTGLANSMRYCCAQIQHKIMKLEYLEYINAYTPVRCELRWVSPIPFETAAASLLLRTLEETTPTQPLYHFSAPWMAGVSQLPHRPPAAA